MWRHLMTGTLTVALAAGCASGPGGYSRTNLNRDVILAPEIAEARVLNAYEAVTRLRPEFLQSRGMSPSRGQATPLVYLDDMQLGSVDALRLVSVDDITSIRFLRPTEAHVRWGTQGLEGVIVVTTSRTPGA
jgi:hypothetical protein